MNQKPVITLEQFIADRKADGYGVALCNPSGHCIDPYVHADDYPGVEVQDGAGACLRRPLQPHPKIETGSYFIAHSGQLEIDPDYLTKA